MSVSSIVNSNTAPLPLGAYPHARRVGNLLFLSGIGPRKRESNFVPGVELDSSGKVISYDIEIQCHSVFANVRSVLEESGSSWNSLLDVTVFLTNLQNDFPIYNKIYGEYFQTAQPCRTTIGVSSLPGPIAIELKCIAIVN